MRENNYARYELAGVVAIDADWTGEKFMKYQWLQMRKPLRLLVCGR